MHEKPVESDTIPSSDGDVRRGGWVRSALLGLLFVLVAGLSFAGGYATRHYLAPLTIEERRVAQGLSPDLEGPLASAQDPAFLALPIDVEIDPDEPAIGPEDARVTIVEYSDFECPFCRLFHQQSLDRILESYPGQIRYVAVDFPLRSIHPSAQRAAEAANCAHEQGEYWPYQAHLFETVDSWSRDPELDSALVGIAEALGLDRARFDDCLRSGRYTDEVNADLERGASYGVNSTPTFFINGQVVVGAQPFESFVSMIESELANGN